MRSIDDVVDATREGRTPHTHFSPQRYAQELEFYKRNHPEPYERLHADIRWFYSCDTALKTYWLERFYRDISYYEESMPESVRGMFHNMFIEARKTMYDEEVRNDDNEYR